MPKNTINFLHIVGVGKVCLYERTIAAIVIVIIEIIIIVIAIANVIIVSIIVITSNIIIVIIPSAKVCLRGRTKYYYLKWPLSSSKS